MRCKVHTAGGQKRPELLSRRFTATRLGRASTITLPLPNWNLPDRAAYFATTATGETAAGDWRDWREQRPCLLMQAYWSTIVSPLTLRHVYSQTLGGDGEGNQVLVRYTLHEAATQNSVRPSQASGCVHPSVWYLKCAATARLLILRRWQFPDFI